MIKTKEKQLSEIVEKSKKVKKEKEEIQKDLEEKVDLEQITLIHLLNN